MVAFFQAGCFLQVKGTLINTTHSSLHCTLYLTSYFCFMLLCLFLNWVSLLYSSPFIPSSYLINVSFNYGTSIQIFLTVSKLKPTKSSQVKAWNMSQSLLPFPCTPSPEQAAEYQVWICEAFRVLHPRFLSAILLQSLMICSPGRQ